MSATNRGSKRIEHDFYETPQLALKPLVELVDWQNVSSFLEPCMGGGAIFNSVLQQRDFYPRVVDYCEIQEGKDYFTENCLINETNKYDLIITNPPFSLAQEFLEKSLQEANCVCYLLRLNFLESKKRKTMWEKIGTPNKLLVLSQRPSFTHDGKTDATAYAWFCWDKHDIIKAKKGITVL